MKDQLVVLLPKRTKANAKQTKLYKWKFERMVLWVCYFYFPDGHQQSLAYNVSSVDHRGHNNVSRSLHKLTRELWNWLNQTQHNINSWNELEVAPTALATSSTGSSTSAAPIQSSRENLYSYSLEAASSVHIHRPHYVSLFILTLNFDLSD